ISSESSYRFERGIDMLALPDAMARAIDLIVSIAGGAVREAPLDLWPEPQQPRSVFLRDARVSQLLGVAIPRKETERLLSAVGFVPPPKDDRLAVPVPGLRPDRPPRGRPIQGSRPPPRHGSLPDRPPPHPP